jgi:hypothetical protein
MDDMPIQRSPRRGADVCNDSLLPERFAGSLHCALPGSPGRCLQCRGSGRASSHRWGLQPLLCRHRDSLSDWQRTTRSGSWPCCVVREEADVRRDGRCTIDVGFFGLFNRPRLPTDLQRLQADGVRYAPALLGLQVGTAPWLDLGAMSNGHVQEVDLGDAIFLGLRPQDFLQPLLLGKHAAWHQLN